MIIIYGTRAYGRILRAGQTFLETPFFHVFFLPLIPLGTQLVLGPAPGGMRHVTRVKMSGRSILAAYLRTWGVLFGAGLVFAAIGMFASALEQHAWLDLVLSPLIVFTTVAAVSGAFFSLGKLTAAEQAQQAVYARFVGAPIDPALLADRVADIRSHVEESLAERARSLGLLGYRHEGEANAEWTKMALSPAVRDLEYLEGALTLARLDVAASRGDARREQSNRHRTIWSRIEELRATRDAARADAAA